MKNYLILLIATLIVGCNEPEPKKEVVETSKTLWPSTDVYDYQINDVKYKVFRTPSAVFVVNYTRDSLAVEQLKMTIEDKKIERISPKVPSFNVPIKSVVLDDTIKLVEDTAKKE